MGKRPEGKIFSNFVQLANKYLRWSWASFVIRNAKENGKETELKSSHSTASDPTKTGSSKDSPDNPEQQKEQRFGSETQEVCDQRNHESRHSPKTSS